MPIDNKLSATEGNTSNQNTILLALLAGSLALLGYIFFDGLAYMAKINIC